MAHNQMGTVSFLLLLLEMHHLVSSAAMKALPYPDVWLTGFEPNLLDGQPVEPVPACKTNAIAEEPFTPTPRPTPKPTTTREPITFKKAPSAKPTAARIVTYGPRLPVAPFRPHSGFVSLLPANGRAGVNLYNAGDKFVKDDKILSPRKGLHTALVSPGNLNVAAVGVFPHNGIMPRRAPIPGSLGSASRWASFLHNRLAQAILAAQQRAVMSSSSSEEYHG